MKSYLYLLISLVCFPLDNIPSAILKAHLSYAGFFRALSGVKHYLDSPLRILYVCTFLPKPLIPHVGATQWDVRKQISNFFPMLLVLQKCRQSFKASFCLSVLFFFFVLTYAALIFDLEIFIRISLCICITPVFKLMSNISAKIVVDGSEEGKDSSSLSRFAVLALLVGHTSHRVVHSTISKAGSVGICQEKTRCTKGSFSVSQIHRQIRTVERKSSY